MGRQIKRVALDFDWPAGKTWPGYMRSICTEEIEYCTGAKYAAGSDKKDNPCCAACLHFARLAGLPIQSFGCPDSSVPPPPGDGWQLWETVSEGSPITPVFATADELIDYMCRPGSGRNGQGFDRATAEAWVKEHGWAPSGVMIGGRYMDGVAGIVEAAKKDSDA